MHPVFFLAVFRISGDLLNRAEMIAVTTIVFCLLLTFFRISRNLRDSAAQQRDRGDHNCLLSSPDFLQNMKKPPRQRSTTERSR